jgi:hypothetical protein
MRWAGHVTHMVDMRNSYRILVSRLKGTEVFGNQNARG